MQEHQLGESQLLRSITHPNSPQRAHRQAYVHLAKHMCFWISLSSAHRAKFILESVIDLRRQLRSLGSDLMVGVGKPEEILPLLAAALNARRSQSTDGAAIADGAAVADGAIAEADIAEAPIDQARTEEAAAEIFRWPDGYVSTPLTVMWQEQVKPPY